MCRKSYVICIRSDGLLVEVLPAIRPVLNHFIFSGFLSLASYESSIFNGNSIDSYELLVAWISVASGPIREIPGVLTPIYCIHIIDDVESCITFGGRNVETH
ncbi:hypothetical protein TNIN_282601 [Trichonephila inaurata madagascariensis]|uniref:Uncharacterized protein n=1 Tax=Trichonephila inaurata madagascariensis TaxID=2747483 RepID=A0A8X6M987_9ARAC|nr:hypothetical protein TNIN_282601 [Trichonephila inaurata madagascariensis]